MLNVTVCVAVPPFSSREPSTSIVTVGAESSSVIVQTPVSSRMVATEGLLSVRLKVSLLTASYRVSPRTGTVTVLDTSPEAKVSVPLVAV